LNGVTTGVMSECADEVLFQLTAALESFHKDYYGFYLDFFEKL
jgi:hypothetical protein